MFELFQYGFIVRGLVAGIAIAGIAPLIGIFLVLRRYSLIADSLAHVSLAGVALGLLLNINPVLTALASAIMSSVVIEKLRLSKRIYGESALAIFLSGSLAFAVILINIAHGFKTDLFNYLFGSIVTVREIDIVTILFTGFLVVVTVFLLYKELVFVSFDEQSAKVAGIPTQFINFVIVVLSAITVSVAIPIVGVLLISALIVIPVVTALQFRRGFLQTLALAEIFSIASVIVGVITSFYLDLSSGGTIVFVALAFFVAALLAKSLLNQGL